MVDWPYLPNAPIIEAIIDFRVQLPKNTTLDSLHGFETRVVRDYPKKRVRVPFEANLGPGTPPQVSSKEGPPDRVLYYSADDRQVVQAGLDGFTFSRLKPYENWDRLRAESKRLWEVYREFAQPVRIERAAVRYVNRLDIPRSVGTDLDLWMHTGPRIAPTLPQAISEALVRVVIPFGEEKATAIVTEAFVPPPSPDVVSLIFDIDVSRVESIDSSDPDLWQKVESLRRVKNRIFFESITRKAEELFR